MSNHSRLFIWGRLIALGSDIIIKSPVTWLGNKSPILHILYALFPARHDRYIEPFGGSGAVLLGKKEADKFEVYNDYNRNLTNLFNVIKYRPDEEIDKIMKESITRCKNKL